jgi:hypothetical protein
MEKSHGRGWQFLIHPEGLPSFSRVGAVFRRRAGRSQIQHSHKSPKCWSLLKDQLIISESLRSQEPRLKRMIDTPLFPLSFAQQRLLFLDRLDPGTSAYNLTRVIRITGSLDVDGLRRAVNIIVDRHTSLRTRFVFDAGDGYQVVDAPVEQQVPLLDLSVGSERS